MRMQVLAVTMSEAQISKLTEMGKETNYDYKE